MIQQENQFKMKLKELEDEILFRLASAEGDITTDVALIEALEDAKRTSNDIQAKMKISKITQEEINTASENIDWLRRGGRYYFF